MEAGDIMRQTDYFEAYLDDYDKIIIYLSKQGYEGVCKHFYLRDMFGYSEDLQILSVEPTSNHYMRYVCRLVHPIVMGREYEVVHQKARATILQYAYIVKRPRFDEEFAYEGNDLGAVYTSKETTFTLWAPTASLVNLELRLNDTNEIHEMERFDRGIYRIKIKKDCRLASYVYRVKVNGNWNETIDPYGKSSTINAGRSVVIDPLEIKSETYNLKPLRSYTDAIIYETSVKDFTIQPHIGITHPGKFLGFVEENNTTKSLNTGFTYLKSLGITHVQLLPVLDFGSVDEYNQNLFYNWGYDPVQFFSFEGSYASDVFDPMSRINDFVLMINKLHEAGIRVVLDVVFNHMFDLKTCSFNKIVPYYYFQVNEEGNYSNGSWCGNDFDSKRKMASKFIIDACIYLVKTFKIDGFRFDLMGILDTDTLNRVKNECTRLNHNMIIYGEGWDMPSYLDVNQRASLGNNDKMPLIGHFSDRFRDVVKGRTSVEEVDIKGYCSGDISLIEVMKNVLSASVTNHAAPVYFTSPQHAINYVECHDNMTCWDKLRDCCKEDTRETRIKRHELCLAATLFAQGVPFIHSGQEFARTKHGKHNTYNNSDSINGIDYERRNRYREVVQYTRECIELRKKYECFSYATTQEISECVSFDEISHSALVYKMKDAVNDVIVIFNPSNQLYEYDLNDQYQCIFYNGKIEPILNQRVKVQPLSVIVLIKP